MEIHMNFMQKISGFYAGIDAILTLSFEGRMPAMLMLSMLLN
jgi:hypothetical protein